MDEEVLIYIPFATSKVSQSSIPSIPPDCICEKSLPGWAFAFRHDHDDGCEVKLATGSQ